MTTQSDRVRGLIGSLGMKAPCVAATTGNITLSAVQTIDGVSVVAEDRVLVKNQTTASENGIYVCQATTWIRAPDFDGARDTEQGTLVNVVGGTINARTAWMLDTADATIGTDSLDFVPWITPAMQTLTDGATVSWDLEDGQMGVLTLGGNRTMAAPTNMHAGEAYALKLIQDGTGSRTVTWNAVFKWPSGTAPTLSTGAADVDLLSFICDGTYMYGVAQKDFS